MTIMEQNQQQSKDVVYFVTKEEMEQQSKTSSSTVSSGSSSTSSQEEAYNPETGEINWDCPCIADMTKPPCGDAFKEAFSCFVYSTSEPKGYDCLDQFRTMQSCFQQYPEIYGAELQEDEENEKEGQKIQDDKQESKESKTITSD